MAAGMVSGRGFECEGKAEQGTMQFEGRTRIAGRDDGDAASCDNSVCSSGWTSQITLAPRPASSGA